MNKVNRGILIGMVLGDGSLVKHTKSNSACLKIKHCLTQREYIEHKAQLLHSILGGNPIHIGDYESYRMLNGTELMIQKSDKYFRILRKWIYKDGKKTIDQRILNYLTPQGLALWWMDDGSLVVRKYATGGTKRRVGSLYTYLSREQNILIGNWLNEKFGIDYQIVAVSKNPEKKFTYLRFNTESMKRLVPILEPYIIPSMKYKIDMQYNTEKRPATEKQKESARKLMYEIHERRRLAKEGKVA